MMALILPLLLVEKAVYDMVSDLRQVLLPKTEKSEVAKSMIKYMFSILEFYVEFISGFRNAKYATIFWISPKNVKTGTSDGNQNMGPKIDFEYFEVIEHLFQPNPGSGRLKILFSCKSG